jgi:hypothetical protein
MLGPATVDGVCAGDGADALRAYWRQADARKREQAPWGAPALAD